MFFHRFSDSSSRGQTEHEKIVEAVQSQASMCGILPCIFLALMFEKRKPKNDSDPCAHCFRKMVLSRALSAMLVAAFIVQTCGNSESCPGCTLVSKTEPFSRQEVHQVQRDLINPCIRAQISALRLRGGSGNGNFPGDEQAADEALDELYDDVKKVHFSTLMFAPCS